jgi:serine phosphatase RsbU (regulator of sigma subunit)
VAGSILPAYDVGGDWIDHCAMGDGGWLGVADAVGKGPQASAIGAIALGAYRADARAAAATWPTAAVPHPRGDLCT